MLDKKQEIINTIYGVITFIKGIFYSIPQEIFLFVLSALFILLILILLYQKKKIRINKTRRDILEKAIFKYDIASGIDKAGFALLDIFKSLISAEGYYLYLRDEKNDQFILKTVRHKEEIEANIAPSYSGLLSFKKDKYIPPLKLESNMLPTTISIIKQGQISLLAVPIGDMGWVHIAPIKHVSSIEKEHLSYASKVLESLLATTVSLQSLKEQVHTQSISTTAIQSLSVTAHDFIGKCMMLIDLTTKMIGAAGGEFLVKAESGNEDLTHAWANSTVFGGNVDIYEKLERLLGNEELQILTRKDKNFYVVPDSLKEKAVEMVIIVDIPARENKGIAVFWYNEIPQGDLHRFTGLQLMMKRLADLFDSHNKYKELTKLYLDMLKMMVETIDNLEPYTVGYSEQMAFYSGIIAREMNLDENIVEDVVLAATLCNIGVLGFSNELIFKTGKYSETEYEKMKLHAEVGAAIVEATVSNQRIPDYIRYHHERIDGFGYPSGLKGDDIPIGARIIAVAQTFLAKINGRRYREPLSFEKAIELIKAASGTQLDTNAVEALIRWFKKKQANSENNDTIGKCWEIRCVPTSICQGCPAYEGNDRNCWEYEGVLCQMHGNTCRSCFIYTEYLYRMMPKF